MAKLFTEQPDNINYLSPVGFRFSIEYIPKTNWFLTSVNLPGISLGEINQPRERPNCHFVRVLPTSKSRHLDIIFQLRAKKPLLHTSP